MIDNSKKYITNDLTKVITMTVTCCSAQCRLQRKLYFSFYLCSRNVMIKPNIQNTFLDLLNDQFWEQFLRKQESFSDLILSNAQDLFHVVVKVCIVTSAILMLDGVTRTKESQSSLLILKRALCKKKAAWGKEANFCMWLLQNII